MDESQEIEIRDLLKTLGLSSFEQKAYLTLLKCGGGLTAQEISSQANIPLTRVYSVMKQLIKIRLVSTNKLNNPIRYNLEKPESSLRFMLRKHVVALEQQAKKMENNLEKILNKLQPTNSSSRGCNIYEEENDVKSLIPSLLASTKNEVLIISDIVNQTLTKEFLNEFIKALDRGVTIKILVPINPHSRAIDLSSPLIKGLDPAQQAKVAMNHWEKRLFIKKIGWGATTQFAIFDGMQVAYSVTSPRKAKYVATLLIETNATVNEFYEDFQKAWQKAIELDYPTALAALALSSIR